MKLSDLGEFPFLRRLRGWVPSDPRVLLGLGDDCAALSLSGTTLLTTDAMIENVHFRREWTSFSVLGEKAFTVNASDIAAMGGEPTFALLSLGVPQECEVEDLDAFFDGFVRAAGACGAALIGGNMSAAPCLMLSVTLLGQAPYGVVTRGGAHVGDDLYATGTLGDAALGLRMLQEGRTTADAQMVRERFLCPTARLAVGCEVAARGLATAMAVLGERDWSVALTGGEDYELLFSAAAEHRAAVDALAQRSACSITRIGRVVPQTEGLNVHGPDGTAYTPAHVGYDHFRLA